MIMTAEEAVHVQRAMRTGTGRWLSQQRDSKGPGGRRVRRPRRSSSKQRLGAQSARSGSTSQHTC